MSTRSRWRCTVAKPPVALQGGALLVSLSVPDRRSRRKPDPSDPSRDLTWWSAARPRLTFSMISSAALVQMKGLGSSFQCFAHRRRALVSSCTLPNTPRRSRRSVSRANHRSTRFSAARARWSEVQVPTGLGRLGQPVGDVGSHVRREIVEDHVHVVSAGAPGGRSSSKKVRTSATVWRLRLAWSYDLADRRCPRARRR